MKRPSKIRLSLLMALTSLAAPSAFATSYEVASRTYDLEAALEVSAERDTLVTNDPTPENRLLAATADLLVAELYRIDFETTAEADRELRRALGEKIDTAAQRGLDRIDDLQESSENLRIRADLIATLIRSKFRGQKYRKSLNQAARRAIELDPGNASAWVSLAKPPTFKPGRDEADLQEALELLGEALTLDPNHEVARVMKGRILLEQGNPAAARAEWLAVLKRNPDCKPARNLLEESQ